MIREQVIEIGHKIKSLVDSIPPLGDKVMLTIVVIFAVIIIVAFFCQED